MLCKRCIAATCSRKNIPFQNTSSIAPNCLLGKFLFYPLQKRSQNLLIFWFKGFSTQNSKSIDKGRLQSIQKLVFCGRGKFLAIAKIPGFLIKAASTAISTPRHKEAYPHSLPVSNVRLLYFTVIHRLQVQHPLLDFLGSALVPVLGSDVAAGTAGHIHF